MRAIARSRGRRPRRPVRADLVRALRYSLIAVVFLGAAWVLYRARSALLPFAVGAVLAVVLAPLVDRLARALPFASRRPDAARLASVVLIYAAGLALLVLFGWVFLPTLTNQATTLLADVPRYAHDAQVQVETWLAAYREQVPSAWQERIDIVIEQLGTALNPLLAGIGSSALRTAGNLFSILLGYLLIPFWLFYVLRDQHKLLPALRRAVPSSMQQDVDACTAIIHRVAIAYIRAQLLLGLIVGAATALGLALMGVPFALLLGLIAGITELIPIVGPILGAVPPLLVVLATDPQKWWWVLLLAVGVQQLENAVLVPHFQGRAVHLHPALVIMLLPVADQTAGLLGMIVVLPLVALLRELVGYAYRRLQAQEHALADQASVRVRRNQHAAGPRRRLTPGPARRRAGTPVGNQASPEPSHRAAAGAGTAAPPGFLAEGSAPPRRPSAPSRTRSAAQDRSSGWRPPGSRRLPR